MSIYGDIPSLHKCAKSSNLWHFFLKRDVDDRWPILRSCLHALGHSFIFILERSSVREQSLAQFPPEYVVESFLAIMSKHDIGRKGICFSNGKEKCQTAYFPSICLHNVVKRRQIITTIIGCINSTVNSLHIRPVVLASKYKNIPLLSSYSSNICGRFILLKPTLYRNLVVSRLLRVVIPQLLMTTAGCQSRKAVTNTSSVDFMQTKSPKAGPSSCRTSLSGMPLGQ